MALPWRRKSATVERRPAARVRPKASEPVRVQLMGGNSIDILQARDISLTGVGVYVEHRFEGCDISADLEMVITLPGRRTFLTRGVIKHVSRQGEPLTYFGVEFRWLSDEHRALIEDYIDRANA